MGVMTPDEAIAELQRVRKLRQEADEALAPAVIAALKAGLGATRIANEVGVSDSHVRSIRREANLPADPRYAHLRPPTTTKDAS